MTDFATITFAPLDTLPRGNIIVFAGEDAALSPVARSIDTQTGGALERAIRIAKFKGKAKTSLELLAPSGIEADRVIIVGLGKTDGYKEEDWIELGGAVRGKLGGVETAGVWLQGPEGKGAISPEIAASVAFGMLLRGYEFKKYKTKKDKDEDLEKEPNEEKENKLSQVTLYCESPDETGRLFTRYRGVAEGVYLARDLVNEPANVLGPEEFAHKAEELRAHGVEVEVLGPGRLRELGMGALLAVGQGSARPSYVVSMRWRGPGAQADAPLAFIGKGVCFDTGGVSIKPAQGMEEMKGDMGGAACITGLMLALAKTNAPVDVVGVLGLTENMPSGTAQRPGDIVTSMSGQTIEVLNTDAEGRMVLADAMWYTQETFKPRFIVTLATLTGAIIVALGKEYAGLYGNDEELCAKLIEAGEETAEKVWRMPLGKKYDKELNSKIADMKNIGGKWAGSITAAQFLQRFVKKDMRWAHLDIAGTALSSPQTDINHSWGSGFGVRLLERLVAKYQQP